MPFALASLSDRIRIWVSTNLIGRMKNKGVYCFPEDSMRNFGFAVLYAMICKRYDKAG